MTKWKVSHKSHQINYSESWDSVFLIPLWWGFTNAMSEANRANCWEPCQTKLMLLDSEPDSQTAIPGRCLKVGQKYCSIVFVCVCAFVCCFQERALHLFGQARTLQSLDTTALGAALAACQTGALSALITFWLQRNEEHKYVIPHQVAQVARWRTSDRGSLAPELGNLRNAPDRGVVGWNFLQKFTCWLVILSLFVRFGL